MTKDWKNIHPNFTEKLQEAWEKEFNPDSYNTYERCKQYIDKGLKPEEADFAKYLWKQRYYSDGSGQWAGENITKKVQELREKYTLWKNIGNFISEFQQQLQIQGFLPDSEQPNDSDEDYYAEKWKSKGFDVEERKEWIRIGLKPDDYEVADAWKNIAGLNVNQVEEWVKLGLQPQEFEFAGYLISFKGYSPHQGLNLEQLREKWKNPPAQEYLDHLYSKEEKKKVKRLDISQKNLTEILDLRDFTSLEELNCSDNHLQDLKFPPQAADSITELNLKNNNLVEQDLSAFQSLTNLKYLWIGNDNQEKIKKGIYNHFTGSLEPLKNLTKLRYLNIDNTDLNSGTEYLPDNLGGVDNHAWKRISYSVGARPESKIQEIKWELDLFTNGAQKNWEALGFTLADIKSWTETGLRINDYYLADYLKHKGYIPKKYLNLAKLRKEYVKALKKQKWFWEGEATEIDLLQRWKKTHPKEQINSLEGEYEMIEKSDEGKVETEKNEQIAQIQQNYPFKK